jgi:hypothetical protein
MSFENVVTRAVGVAAFGMAANLTSPAMAQPPSPASAVPSASSIYAPPPPTSDVYHPGPGPYHYTSVTPAASVNPAPSKVVDSGDWFKNNRLPIYGGFVVFGVMFAGCLLWLVRGEKNEKES